MPELTAAASQMVAQVGKVGANLAHATTMLEQGAARTPSWWSRQICSAPNARPARVPLDLPKPHDGPTRPLIVDTTRLIRCQLGADHQSD